jgi:hypothetical protein
MTRGTGPESVRTGPVSIRISARAGKLHMPIMPERHKNSVQKEGLPATMIVLHRAKPPFLNGGVV